jgi:uncharacterized protein YlxP (DUF503 family)
LLAGDEKAVVTRRLKYKRKVVKKIIKKMRMRNVSYSVLS